MVRSHKSIGVPRGFTANSARPVAILPDVARLLDDLDSQKPIIRSESVLELAQRVVKKHESGQDEDIDAWVDMVAHAIAEFEEPKASVK